VAIARAAKAAIRVIATAVAVAEADGDVVHHHADVAAAVEAVAVAAVTVVPQAKIIRARKQGIAMNRANAKTKNFAHAKPSARMVRVTKTKMSHPRWTKRPKAKALPKPPPTNHRTRLTNFTKNAPMLIASDQSNECAKSAARVATVVTIVVAGIGIANGDAAAPTNATVQSTAFCAAKSIAFAIVWNPSCAILNASSARCNKPSTNAS
jgi:hypothetical protein